MIFKILILAFVAGVALSASILHSTEECVPGSSFKIDCNECFCLEDGSAACTRELCPNSLQDLRLTSIVEQTRCIPGETFKDDCNSCYCLVGGIPACTKIFCQS